MPFTLPSGVSIGSGEAIYRALLEMLSVGSVSAENSSAVALGVGGVFTGTWIDVSALGSVCVNVFSNVASAINGLSIQQSSDGVNADFTDVYTIAAATGAKFTSPVQAKFARVVYTNGGTLQAAFRLQTLLSLNKPNGEAVRPQDGYTNETDMSQVEAFGMLWNATGAVWDRERVGPYQLAQTPLIGASGNVANAAAVATLTPGSTATAYLSGFEVTGAGATVGLPVTVTVAGVLGGTRSYTYVFAAGALLPNQPLIAAFNPPLPAAAINTPIVVTCPAGGTGNTNNTVVAHGFSQ